jgi:superfamily II DNA/RNA helicase
MERRALNLSGFATVVLDEADRMLDMGFIGDMREIMGFMPEVRHTLFFSATLSREIEQLIGAFLNDPVRVSVKTRDTAHTIDQDVIRIEQGRKFEQLVELLQEPEFDKVLVFGRTKHGVERLSKDLMRAGIPAESIHGDKTHGRRQKALGLFKQDKVRVLVATDVAARGLDISGVSHVINYDLPATYEDYTHRIGRTGRAGKTGKALTFI